MNRFAEEGHLSSFTKIDMPTCERILLVRLLTNHLGRLKRVECPLQAIHYDICCLINVKENCGATYFITFIDDFTRFDMSI